MIASQFIHSVTNVRYPNLNWTQVLVLTCADSKTKRLLVRRAHRPHKEYSRHMNLQIFMYKLFTFWQIKFILGVRNAKVDPSYIGCCKINSLGHW